MNNSVVYWCNWFWYLVRKHLIYLRAITTLTTSCNWIRMTEWATRRLDCWEVLLYQYHWEVHVFRWIIPILFTPKIRTRIAHLKLSKCKRDSYSLNLFKYQTLLFTSRANAKNIFDLAGIMSFSFVQDFIFNFYIFLGWGGGLFSSCQHLRIAIALYMYRSWFSLFVYNLFILH